MKNAFTLLLVLLFPSLVWDMGDNNQGSTTIPLPEKNYSVVITDAQKVQTTADRVSWEGKVYLQGHRGEALTTIPFEKISQVELDPNGAAMAGAISAKVTLKNGEAVLLQIRGTSKAYGETSFGNFEIYLRDIEKIVFAP